MALGSGSADLPPPSGPESIFTFGHEIGHAEKQRARGAMALKGALDCEYRLEKEASI